jgi:tetratricopeptide (TPR) repeat protein
MPEESDILFQEAVEALHAGDRARAKDLLTRLLKTEQNNAAYWVWMSAAVETAKERVYCLQMALRIDPANASAKRGMVLLGAAPPEETVQPFPVNRPRAWEEELKLSFEKPKEKKPLLSRPIARIAGLSALGIVVCGLVFFLFILPRGGELLARPPTNTPGPSPTYTLTPTFINATAPVTPTFVGPTPLWAQLPATYTPTPFYLTTVDDPQLTEIMRAIKAAYAKGNWEEMRTYVQQGISIRPDLPDFLYLLGESYRFEDKSGEALDAYTRALEVNPNFGPAYVGLARLELARDENADILGDLDLAIQVSPDFTEAYLLRAAFKRTHNDPPGALTDVQAAEKLSPVSALVFLEYSRVYLALGQSQLAVDAARRANELDITMLPVYLALGEAYVANNQPGEAAKALQTYMLYAPEDPAAFFELGKLHYLAGEYELAFNDLKKSIEYKNVPEARLYYGLTLVELERSGEAVFELDNALDYFPNSFIARLGMVRALILDGKFGSAAIEADTALTLAETDEQKAQVYYWRAKAYDQQPSRLADAKRDWEALLAMPENAMPSAWRREAQQRLAALTTPSVTPTVTKTGTPTKTPSPTRTPSPGPSPTPTPTK